MKKYSVTITVNKYNFFSDIDFKDFEDDTRNRRVIIRATINNNKLHKTIIPYEAIECITITEMEV